MKHLTDCDGYERYRAYPMSYGERTVVLSAIGRYVELLEGFRDSDLKRGDEQGALYWANKINHLRAVTETLEDPKQDRSIDLIKLNMEAV